MASMLTRSVPRATRPHLPSLNTTLAPLLAVANAGAFVTSWAGTAVIIEQSSFAGCDLVAIDAAVASAPTYTDELDAQAWIDNMPISQKAILLTLLDQLNIVRAALPSPLGAITPAQAIAAVRTKAGTL